uniref:helix-turn-helix domain-containing protein n=1 Tax=Gemmiger formicilis TaxID=745368 RepID=UPI004024CB72
LMPVRSGAAVTAPVTKFAKQWRKNKMGMFKNTLLLAQQGNEKAMEKLLNRYDPLLKKCSIIQGHFDEDLYQSLILEFVRAVSAFKI